MSSIFCDPSFEELDFLDPAVARCLSDVQFLKNSMRLSGVLDETLTLDFSNTEYICQFLNDNPAISVLFLKCNIKRNDGAMERLVQFLQQTSQIKTLGLWGNFQTCTVTQANLDDDGSILNCVVRGVKGNTSLRELRFSCFDFNEHDKLEAVQEVLNQAAGNLQQLAFLTCDFGPDPIPFLQQACCVPEALQEIQMEGKLQDSTLVAFMDEILNGTSRHSALRVLTLAAPSIGDIAQQAINKVIAHPDCPLKSIHLSTGKQGALYSFPNEKEELVQLVKKYNTSLIDFSLNVSSDEENALLQELIQNQLRPSFDRNRLIGLVHSSLARDLNLSTWSQAFTTLANHPRFGTIGASPLYLAISKLAPKLAQQVQPTRVRERTSVDTVPL